MKTNPSEPQKDSGEDSNTVAQSDRRGKRGPQPENPRARETGPVPARASSSAKNFPVVCVGGSAGGLDAYTRLLQHLPADMGVAIVIVNHLRTVATQLHEILPRFTAMPVSLITEQLDLAPDHVFIIPERRDLHVLDGEFRLKPISKPHGWPNVITVFLRSMIRNWEGKLIAVIVSGYDGDGAEALCGIKEVGGITIAQKLDTAKQPDMPESAIASGCIDFILSPEAIAGKIAEIAHAETRAQGRAKEDWSTGFNASQRVKPKGLGRSERGRPIRSAPTTWSPRDPGLRRSRECRTSFRYFDP